MKARDAINATATILSRMSPKDRAAVARVLTMPGTLESVTQQAIYDDVKAIATRSVTADVRGTFVRKIEDIIGSLETGRYANG
jgi:hypothetical protein